MKTLNSISSALVALAIALTLACSGRPSQAPDVTGDLRHSLEQAGLNDVSVSQDRDKSVVTLTGKVATADEKARAESIARSKEEFRTRFWPDFAAVRHPASVRGE